MGIDAVSMYQVTHQGSATLVRLPACPEKKTPGLTSCDDINAADAVSCETYYTQLEESIPVYKKCKWFPEAKTCLAGQGECQAAASEVAASKWKPILQYDDMYTPNANAVNEEALDSATDFTDAKLSDEAINGLGSKDADGWFYYLLESKTDYLTENDKPFPKLWMFLRSKADFKDTSNGWGLTDAFEVCKEESFESCESKWKTGAKGSGIDLMRVWGDDCERWLTDFYGTIACFGAPGGVQKGQRCASGGIQCKDPKNGNKAYPVFKQFRMSKHIG